MKLPNYNSHIKCGLGEVLSRVMWINVEKWSELRFDVGTTQSESLWEEHIGENKSRRRTLFSGFKRKVKEEG